MLRRGLSVFCLDTGWKCTPRRRVVSDNFLSERQRRNHGRNIFDKTSTLEKKEQWAPAPLARLPPFPRTSSDCCCRKRRKTNSLWIPVLTPTSTPLQLAPSTSPPFTPSCATERSAHRTHLRRHDEVRMFFISITGWCASLDSFVCTDFVSFCVISRLVFPFFSFSSFDFFELGRCGRDPATDFS